LAPFCLFIRSGSSAASGQISPTSGGSVGTKIISTFGTHGHWLFWVICLKPFHGCLLESKTSLPVLDWVFC
jgi:hypothetical protein